MVRIDIYLKPSITAVVGWIQPPLISKWSKLSTFTERQQFSKWWHPRTRRAYFLRPDDYGATTVTGKILKRAPRIARVEIQKSSSMEKKVDLTIDILKEMLWPQGDFNCDPSSHPDFIKNNFLSNFPSNVLKFPLKFSISSQPVWQAGTIKATLLTVSGNKRLFIHPSLFVGRGRQAALMIERLPTSWFF